MCLLIFIPPCRTPDRQGLKNASHTNRDGFGYAVEDSDGTGFIVGKSMKFEEAADEFYEIRAQHPNGVALFHLRFATHGTEDVDNVHPFYVGDDQRVLMAHNGILPIKIPSMLSHMSDTRYFAECVMPKFVYDLDDQEWMTELEALCAGNSKLVVLASGDASLRYSWYIVNEEAGDWNHADGCWYSNDGWKYARYSLTDDTGWGDDWESSMDWNSWLNRDRPAQKKPKTSLEGMNCYHCGVTSVVDHADMDEDYWCKNAVCGVCLLCDSPRLECVCRFGEARDYENDPGTHGLNDPSDYEPYEDDDDGLELYENGHILHVKEGEYLDLKAGTYKAVDGWWVAVAWTTEYTKTGAMISSWQPVFASVDEYIADGDSLRPYSSGWEGHHTS